MKDVLFHMFTVEHKKIISLAFKDFIQSRCNQSLYLVPHKTMRILLAGYTLAYVVILIELTARVSLFALHNCLWTLSSVCHLFLSTLLPPKLHLTFACMHKFPVYADYTYHTYSVSIL